MKFKNPMIRQLCLGWTSLVLSMENVDLESFIPPFQKAIFDPGMQMISKDGKYGKKHETRMVGIYLAHVVR